jgi:hypothetical protein
MQSIEDAWWCPRCGTLKLKHRDDPGGTYVPWIVERTKIFISYPTDLSKINLQECFLEKETLTEREIRRMLADREMPPYKDDYRASGDAECPVCGYLIRLHPLDKELLSYDKQPFLHVLCNGDRVKT